MSQVRSLTEALPGHPLSHPSERISVVGRVFVFPADALVPLVAAGSSNAKLVAAAADITAKVIGKPPNGCIPTLTEGPGEVPGDGPGDDSAWGYQSCTENLHQFSARGPIRSYTCVDAFALHEPTNRTLMLLFH